MLKPTTKQLIESFRYRREGYLPRSAKSSRKAVARGNRIDRYIDPERLVAYQLRTIAYRKHLATLHSTNGG